MQQDHHNWLSSPIRCNGIPIFEPLAPSQINESTLPEICLRMSLILDSIEYERAEGRFMNLDVFEMIDSLCDDLLNHKRGRMDDCHSVIQKFGEHYQLTSSLPINVTVRAVDGIRRLADQLNVSIGPPPG